MKVGREGGREGGARERFWDIVTLATFGIVFGRASIGGVYGINNNVETHS